MVSITYAVLLVLRGSSPGMGRRRVERGWLRTGLRGQRCRHRALLRL